MKRKLWISIAMVTVVVVFTACLKSKDNVEQQCVSNTLAQDQHVIDSFKNRNNFDYLNYNPTYSAYIGMSTLGDGEQPTSNSEIALRETIKLLNGTVIATDSVFKNRSTNANLKYSDFESTSPIYYLLTNGKLNGTMRLVYPSSTNALGWWGCQSQVLQGGIVVPAYSQIIIDYTLTGIKN